MNLDTRLVQLDAAINMELWQEAYKAVEDIHGLMSLSKKVFQPKMMANYYQKLALVFWKSGNYLFHAAAVRYYPQKQGYTIYSSQFAALGKGKKISP